MAYATVTLSGTYQTPDGTPHKGHVELIPSERVIKDTTGNVILTGRVKVELDAQGAFSVALPATDDPTLNPTGFGYTIAAKLHSSHPPAVSFSLPASLGATTVEDLTPVDPSTFTSIPTNYASAEGQLAGKVAETDGADGWRFIDTPTGGTGGGVTDHGALTGLTDDDHTQYALTDGSRGNFAPTTHTHTSTDVTDLGTAATMNAATLGDATTLELVKGDDTRLTDARTPTTHIHPTTDITGLATVATSGSYADLTAQPTIPSTAADVGAEPAGAVANLDATLATVAKTGSYTDLTDTPAGETWQDYTPSFTATTTNPTLGSGGLTTGRYMQNGATVTGWALISFGSTSASPGSGAYEITLPTTARAASINTPARHGVLGVARIHDNGTTYHTGVVVIPDGGDGTKIRIILTNGAQVTNAAPMTFAANDRIWIEYEYEAETPIAGGGGGGGGSAVDTSSFAKVADTPSAPHVQFGATTKTLNGGFSVLGLQNNDPAAPDAATRVYIVPRKNQHPATGVGGALKIFGDDYFADNGTAADYRDLGIYFHANQGTDTGTNGAGVFWVNSKTSGAYTNQNPDIGFSFQDGAAVAGRFAFVFGTGGLAGQSWPTLVVGPNKPAVATKSAIVGLEMQKDIGFTAGNGFRWLDGSSNLTNLVQLNADDFTLKLNGIQQLQVTKAGTLVQATSQLAAGSVDGFFYVRSINAAPTGVPIARTGTVPVSIDTTNNKLWAYVNGSWKGVTLA